MGGIRWSGGIRWALRGAIAVALAVTVLLVFSGCEEAGTTDDGGDNGDNGDDPGAVTLEDGDSWRLIGLGIDDESTWFSVIDSTVAGAEIDITMTAISDQDPPAGSTDTGDFTEDADNVVTFMGGDSIGRLNTLGTTFAIRGSDLEDDYGELMVGVRNGSGLDDSTMSGTYWVAIVYADTDYASVYFTATMDLEVASPGLFRTSNPVSDMDFDGYITDPDTMEYEIASDGFFTMPEGEEVYGIVREDGELFTLGEIYGTPAEPDNTQKTLMYGIQLQSGASGDLLAGTWDVCASCVGEAPDSWGEHGGEMVLDSIGVGTLIDSNGTEMPVALDLNDDGTFTFTLDGEAFELHGAITPSGDTALIVSPAIHPEDEEYCIVVAIKEP